MSVPLDRLYNFLQDIASRNDHIIIYRFSPHGSKKINDLTPLKIHNLQNKTAVDSKFVFFHDQEPLSFDLYSSPNMLKEIVTSNNPSKNLITVLNPDLIEQCQDFLSSTAAQVNIRIAGIEHGLWFKPVILVHSELRSSELQRYQEQDFIGVYWWSHALIARDWFRYAEHDPTLGIKKIQTSDFLIYNRAWSGTREYRLKFVELLIQNNLTDHCLTWFSPTDQNCNYADHEFKNSSLQIENYNLHQYFEPTLADATQSADYCSENYQSTRIEVVLETLFDDDRIQLTEKILRPIACGQPFILAGPQGSLEYLRNYGFETFSAWINETYDTIEDPAQRLEAIVQEMKRIAELSQDEKILLYTRLQEITARNKRLFFSLAWQQSIVEEFQQNFDVAFTKLEDRLKYPL
jgi:hypothetical protein